jgi:hypothetical protein
LSSDHPTKGILPITFREGDQHAQPGEQSIKDRIWAEGPRARGPKNLGQHLAAKLAEILRTDPSAGFEEVVKVFPQDFPGTILVPTQEKAIQQAIRFCKGLSIWSDGPRLESG